MTTFWMASFWKRPKSSTGACAPTARPQNLDHSRDRSPIHPPPERNAVSSDTSASKSESESPVISAPEPKSHSPLTNRDWWPDQIDVSTLRPHAPAGNPLGEDFDYAAEFATSMLMRSRQT